MMASIAKAHYLRSPLFDNFFIWGVPLVAAMSVAIVLWRPELLFTVILLDLSLLGYHHVIATYTRFDFSNENRKKNLWLLVYLPPLVLASVAALSFIGGIALITTIYLHWQWWHYTRQSEGISKAYSMKNGSSLAGNPAINRIVFYLVPVATFLSMSSRNMGEFLSTPVYTLPVPTWLAKGILIISVLALMQWMFIQCKAFLTGKVPPLVLTYFLSHFTIYIFAYHFIDDITTGWLLINIWHNLQYITFVWACNVNQFGSGKVKTHKIKAWLCRPQHWFIYFAACYLLTELLYSGIDSFIVWSATGSIATMTIIVYQTINFHHYIVDTLIWKLRKNPVRSAVGITSDS